MQSSVGNPETCQCQPLSSFNLLQVSSTHLVEVTRVRVQVPLMVEMSSILDPTNRGPRRAEILLAAAAYPKML